MNIFQEKTLKRKRKENDFQIFSKKFQILLTVIIKFSILI